MKVAVVIHARLASRLPGKVLLPLGGKPLLERLVRRVQSARHGRRIVVATTTHPTDDPIAAVCQRVGVGFVRADNDDPLSAHLMAAAVSDADAVVKIPADCPLIDPQVIDCVINAWHASEGRYDYLSNLHPASWPSGNDVEVVCLRALRTASREATLPFDREQTTPFVWSQPDRFRQGNVTWPAGLDYSRSRRWVVEWPEDYAFVCAVFDRLAKTHGPSFGVQPILRLLEREPDLLELNARHLTHAQTMLRVTA